MEYNQQRNRLRRSQSESSEIFHIHDDNNNDDRITRSTSHNRTRRNNRSSHNSYATVRSRLRRTNTQNTSFSDADSNGYERNVNQGGGNDGMSEVSRRSTPLIRRNEIYSRELMERRDFAQVIEQFKNQCDRREEQCDYNIIIAVCTAIYQHEDFRHYIVNGNSLQILLTQMYTSYVHINIF